MLYILFYGYIVSNNSFSAFETVSTNVMIFWIWQIFRYSSLVYWFAEIKEIKLFLCNPIFYYIIPSIDGMYTLTIEWTIIRS